jgi:hypothetical protein
MKLKILNLSNLFILLTLLAAWYTTASVVKPFLHYHNQQTGFLTSIEFFKNFSTYPGGISEYLAEFIAQFFLFNSPGSLLIVAVASLLGFITLDIVKRLVGEIKFRYTIFTLILIFGIIVLCDYRYPYYASIRLLIASVFTWVFCLVNSKYPKFSVAAWIIFASLLFYLASGPALFVFSLSTAIIFIATNKQRIWLLFIPFSLLAAVLIPYLGQKFMFQMSLKNLYRITMVKPPEQLAYTPEWQLFTYYLLIPAMLLIVYILSRFPEKAINTKKTMGKTDSKMNFFKRPPVILSIQVVGCAVCGYLLFQKTYDPFKQKLITLEYYAENEQWTEILKLAEEIEIYDFRVNYHVNRAYSHLGALPDQLFSYPQLLGTYGLFVDPGMQIGSSTMPTSDLYFDLGFMSESQHWAFEAQTLLPNSPRILKRLVMINLVNRKYNLAEKFLKVLDQNMLYHDWVLKYSEYVSDTTLASTDKVIAEKRRFNPSKKVFDYGILNGLKLLVETNEMNRMAYDYLLTFCILDSNFPDFIEYLKDYTRFNLKKMPRSWEEMLSMYIIRTKTIPSFVTPETVSNSCRQRISDFYKTVNQFNGDLSAAKNALHQNFGDTYWYYMFYLSPKVTNILKNNTEVR